MNPVIGSEFEIALRILLMLDELVGTDLDEQQIRAADFIAVYAADFGLLDENLHGYGAYRFSEYPARRGRVAHALRWLVLRGYVRLLPGPAGYSYSITDAGRNACAALDGDYAREYALAVRAVGKRFGRLDAGAMLAEINRATIQSLRGTADE